VASVLAHLAWARIAADGAAFFSEPPHFR
jgi:hypothetical protein